MNAYESGTGNVCKKADYGPKPFEKHGTETRPEKDIYFLFFLYIGTLIFM